MAHRHIPPRFQKCPDCLCSPSLPRLKGRDQLSMTPLMTSARTCWAAKPTMATNSEGAGKLKVALSALVVLKSPLMQIKGYDCQHDLDILRRNLI